MFVVQVASSSCQFDTAEAAVTYLTRVHGLGMAAGVKLANRLLSKSPCRIVLTGQRIQLEDIPCATASK